MPSDHWAVAWSARASCRGTGPEPASRCTVHHPDASERNHSAPSGPKVGCTTETSSPPATTTCGPRPSGPRSARSSDGGVPRHARVVPRDPGDGPAVGRDRGPRHEVGARRQHLAAVGVGTVQVEPHQLVGRLGVARMVLAHRVDVLAVQHQPAEAPRPRRRDRHRLGGAGVEPVDPVVTRVREDHGAVEHGIRATAVLVHAGARVPRGRQHVVGRGAVVPHQHGAAGLARAALEPVGVAAVDAHLVEGHLPRRQGLRGDRRGPGAVGEAHGPTV